MELVESVDTDQQERYICVQLALPWRQTSGYIGLLQPGGVWVADAQHDTCAALDPSDGETNGRKFRKQQTWPEGLLKP